jgi:RNA polymerase sigma factor (sigma-70 family)
MAHAAPAAPRVDPSLWNRSSDIASTDKHLLQQFLSETDETAEAAFAALVERYGPIVHRVCLDVLGCPHEAQDAAQAVFLVLARKARSIRKPASLGPWLHGVALRVARRARSEAAQRRAAERKKAAITHERDNAEWGGEVMYYDELHEEINRLPDKYRQPIVLVYLQGQTQPQAARTLGWPLGTVQIRLHRGRARLRSRLARHGAGLIGLTGANLTSSHAATPGMLEREWTATTARAAVRFAAGKGTAGLVAPPVTGLAESVLAAMVGQSLKVVALTLISLVLVFAGLGLTGWPRKQSRPEIPQIETMPEPVWIEPVLESPARIVDENDRSAPPIIQVTEKPRIAVPADPRSERTAAFIPSPTNHSDKGPALTRSTSSPGGSLSLAAVSRPSDKTLSMGHELFERVWVKNDPRGHGGDGLGPVFNGQSCVGCHNLGGSGGAGTVDKNIEIATVTGFPGEGMGYYYSFSMDFGAGRFDYRLGGEPERPSRRRPQADATLIGGIHPGLRDSNSTVLHHFGTDPAYHAWRGSVPGRHGAILIQTSERNPTALFGVGRIDTIPEEAIEAAAKRRFPGAAQVKGRISRLKDGRIGRFGWKAQTATLEEFVRQAAAGEIGLEVPGRHQAADPRLPGLAATGLDMDETECEALVEYARSMPVPVTIKPSEDKDSAQWKAGEATFKSIGCAACHMPKLGDVDGIYTDLLLHDMGPQLGDSDTYTVFVGEPSEPDVLADAGRMRNERGTPSVREWRTPPLWGVRDSGPYMHDGRAATIASAILLHAGQGTAAARRYAELSPRRKQQVEAFLLSLEVPAADRN